MKNIIYKLYITFTLGWGLACKSGACGSQRKAHACHTKEHKTRAPHTKRFIATHRTYAPIEGGAAEGRPPLYRLIDSCVCVWQARVLCSFVWQAQVCFPL